MQEERRSYFRIDELVRLDYQIVDDQQLGRTPAESTFANASEYRLLSKLQTLDIEGSKYLHRLAESHPDLANFLKIQSNKIDMLARELVSSSGASLPPSQHVSLSEGGIAFLSRAAVVAGSTLALRVMLQADVLMFSCYAEVVNCRQNAQSDGRFTIATQFIDLAEDDQSLLAKHIIRQQARQRRAERERKAELEQEQAQELSTIDRQDGA